MPRNEGESQLTADTNTAGVSLEKTGVSLKKTAATDDELEKTVAASESTTPDMGLVRTTALRMTNGARHTWAALRHILTTGNQSDEEMRRRLVLRQLTAYDSVRETAREELDEVRKRITRLEHMGVDEGWTPEQRVQVKALRDERKRRERAAADLAREPFRAVQPTRAQIRRARYGSSARRIVALSALSGAFVWLLVAHPRLLLLAALVAVCGLLWAGGRPPALAQRPIPAELLARPELAPPPAESVAEEEAAAEVEGETDLRGVTDPTEAADRIRRALLQEGARIGSVDDTRRTPWGWETTVLLTRGTAEDIGRILPKLNRAFRKAQTFSSMDPDGDQALVTLRVLTSDPFANPPAFTGNSPLSCSIRQPFSPMIGMDGSDTPLMLAGLHVLIVAVTGGGKSSLVRALAEYVTACRDAVAWDIDPTGRGLGPLRSAAGHRAYTPEDAEKALARLLTYAERRIAALPETQDSWKVTPEAPAIVAFLDEYPRLTPKGKELALDLVGIGRKARVTLVICTRDATADMMGDAVSENFGIRVMMPCRAADVPLVVGRATAVAEGWQPHHLVPGEEGAEEGMGDPADAGRCYVVAPRHKTPLLRYTLPLDPFTALRLARERVAVGLPAVDAATTGERAETELPRFARLMLDAFAAADNPEHMPVAQLTDYLAGVDGDRWRQWDERKDRNAQAGRAIQGELTAAGLTVPSARDTSKKDRPMGYRLEDLRAALNEFTRPA
jgi:hypothetical protein